jgi:hypothetical protein
MRALLPLHLPGARMSTIVCYSRCWSCMFGYCYDPPQPHPWWNGEDVEHAKATGQLAPEGDCTCSCARSADANGGLA